MVEIFCNPHKIALSSPDSHEQALPFTQVIGRYSVPVINPQVLSGATVIVRGVGSSVSIRTKTFSGRLDSIICLSSSISFGSLVLSSDMALGFPVGISRLLVRR